MTPEEARRWLKEGMETGSVPQLHARRALQTIAAMEYEYSIMRPHHGTHVNVERWHPSLDQLHDIDPPDARDKIAQRQVTPARAYEWNS